MIARACLFFLALWVPAIAAAEQRPPIDWRHILQLATASRSGAVLAADENAHLAQAYEYFHASAWPEMEELARSFYEHHELPEQQCIQLVNIQLALKAFGDRRPEIMAQYPTLAALRNDAFVEIHDATQPPSPAESIELRVDVKDIGAKNQFRTTLHTFAGMAAALLWLVASTAVWRMRAARKRKTPAGNLELENRLQITEEAFHLQARHAAAAERAARTDGLTGLVNRRGFDDLMALGFDRWQAERGAFSIVLTDIDHFKSFNDNHGHQAGDFVLKQVANKLSEAIEENGSAVGCRYGGEEFAFILSDANLADSAAAAEQLRSWIAESAFDYEGESFRVTISCGTAQASDSDFSPKALIERADKALYAAKQAGRNGVFMHDGKQLLPLQSPACASVGDFD